ncbi:armadillo-type protein [Kockovaella imperatae]|uniref:Armadillo-type protein n=1 Tax=Kockovaella imperatae TaxID=4999 RepID=A0A1Y1UNX6_9TREE|nr:armadillo-type protein [Kockovaella imperatae]ORX39750.1 armadillo-type protein [Kockovaella imperatae]
MVQLKSKKRPADGGDDHFKKGKRPQREAVAAEPDKRRKQPITKPQPVSGGSDDGDEMDMNGQDEENGGYQEEEQQQPAKRPRMTKAERAALHAAQPHRTALLPSAPLLQNTLLPLWETARRADLGKEERLKAVRELWDAVKGRVGEVSRGHKGGRVLQTIVKYGGKEERLGVAMELEPQWRAMMESKYSKFLMSKLIHYVPQLRPLLIPAITPHLRSLLFHAEAVGPLSDFFDLYASAKERRLLVRGFYPKEVKIFAEGKGEEGLQEVLEGMGDGAGRSRVLSQVEKTVVDVFNATQKTALAQGIFHRLVNEYLACVNRFLTAEEADTKMHELLTAALESLPDIVHTKDGSAVVRELIVRGSAKDRKQILQQLRKHIEAMCKDSDAQMVLFTAFDCVDDTKLMGKAFVADIVALAPSLVGDINGRRALLYLLTPTSRKHYIPSALTSLAASAQQARDIGTSKKDPATRRKELVGYASPGLLEAVTEHGAEWVRDPGAGLAVQEIMLYSEGDKSSAVNALIEPLKTPYPHPAPTDEETNAESSHTLDLPHASRTYKTLVSGGHYNSKTQSVDAVDAELSRQMADGVWEAIASEIAGGEDNVKNVAKGNAALLLVEVISVLHKNGKGGQVRSTLKGSVKDIRKGGRKGSELLASSLESL